MIAYSLYKGLCNQSLVRKEHSLRRRNKEEAWSSESYLATGMLSPQLHLLAGGASEKPSQPSQPSWRQLCMQLLQ